MVLGFVVNLGSQGLGLKSRFESQGLGLYQSLHAPCQFQVQVPGT